MTTKAFYYTIAVALAWVLAWALRSTKARQVLFLVVSYALYVTWGLGLLGLLIVSSLVNYALGKFLKRNPSAGRLWIGLGFNLALLGRFKYLPAIAGAWSQQSHTESALANIVLPVGISFWTFEALSYLLDLYRGEELEPSLLEFCLYMAFWPTVLSGPICRLPNLLPQFRQPFEPSKDDLRTGLDRVFVGLFMMALSQIIGAGVKPGGGVDAAFAHTAGWGGLDVWVLAIGYGFQLFFDFASYSHIVIGAARLFGIRLEENFARPYLATTPSVFWTRWHMSLSFWIRDYLFLPLATARREMWWRNFALVFSMVIFGLWHGAALLFLIWGTYQGVLLLLHRQWQQLQRRTGFNWPDYIATPISWMVTFAGISVGWVFFRANSLGQVRAMLGAIFSPSSYHQFTLPASFYWLVLVLVGGYFCWVAGIQVALERRGADFRKLVPLEVQFAAYALMLYIAVLHTARPQSFIYFQF